MINVLSAIKNQQKGMSLLEIMVSFFILALVFVSLSQAFPFSSAIVKTAENATKASYLAQAKVEELNLLGYDNIAVGTIEAKHRLSNDTASYLYFFQRETTVNYVDGNLQASLADEGLKKITVSVYYIEGLSKNEKIYTITFLISRL